MTQHWRHWVVKYFLHTAANINKKRKIRIDAMMTPRRRLLLALLTAQLLPVNSIGFANPQAQGMLERDSERLIKEHKSSKHFAKPKDKDNDKAGSKEYYQGFVSSDLVEEEDRVTGDALLGPTFKFVGSVSVLIAALLLVFLISNGLLY